jgi:hypothetical protein
MPATARTRGPDPPAEAWERQPEETARAYAAFSRFRELGPGRTLSEAYRTGTGRKEAAAPSGQWRGWYAAHRWRERAERWDAHLARLATAEREREHLSHLAEYRERQRQLARATAEGALKLLKRAGDRLDGLEEIPAAALPAFYRAAAAVADSASSAEAQALAVDELLSLLERSHEENADA